MKIQSSAPKPRPLVTSEPITPETLADYPDLPVLMDCEQCRPSSGSTLGYEYPLTDQSFIRERSGHLEKRLELIPKELLQLQKSRENGGTLAGVGTALFTGGLAVATGSALLNPSTNIIGTFSAIGAVGLGLFAAGASKGTGAAHSIKATQSEYYRSRTELDHLRRQEAWSPSSYIAPSPDDLV